MALTDNLLRYYKLDETSGTTVTDSTGTGNGTSSNCTVNQSGKINTSYSFNGTTSYITSAITANNGSQTWSCWFYPTSNSVTQNIIARRASGGGNNIAINLLSGGTLRSDFDGLSSNASVATSNTVNLNAWNFVSIAWDSGTNNHKIILNGTKTSATTTGTPNVTENTVSIGRNGAMSQYYFVGRIDEVGYWNRALSDTEISTLYNGGSGLAYPFTATNTTNFFFMF